MAQPAFNLGAMLSAPQPLKNEVKDIPCEMLTPYHNHRFQLYSGERLEDMVESIRQNGVLCPIVVQPLKDGSGKYEILIGHNRWHASKLAEIDTVPAIIKEGLSEEEAEMYVIESNLMQRGFDNLLKSEQAAVVALRYNSMFSQGKRNDILKEIAMLERGEISADNEFTTDSAKSVGEEYGLCKSSIKQLLRINKLTDDLKSFVDTNKIPVLAGVELSFLNEETQREIASQAQGLKVDIKKAKALKMCADNNGYVAPEVVQNILVGKLQEIVKTKSIRIRQDIYSRYFPENTKTSVVEQTVENALEMYFAAQKNKDEDI